MSMIGSTQPSLSKLPTSHLNVIWDLTESVITILSSFTEIKSDITEALSKISVIPSFLFGLLEVAMAPDRVKEAAMLCLYSLISDDWGLAEKLAERSDWLQHLSSHSNKSDVVGIAACGVIYEMNALGAAVEVRSELSILKSLDAQLDRHCFRAASNAEKLVSNGNVAESEKALGLVLDLIASIAADTHIQAESGLLPEDDDFEGFADDDDMEESLPGDSNGLGLRSTNDSDSDSTSNGTDEDMEEEPVTNGERANGDEDANQLSSSLQGYDTLQRFLANSTTPKILSLFKAFQHDSASSDTHRTSRSALPSRPASSIRDLLLQTLTSIAWTLSTAALLTSLRQQWQSQAQDIWKTIICPVLSSNTADIDLASSIASLAWGVSRSLSGRINLENDEHKKFMSLYQASLSLPQDSIHEKYTKSHPEGSDASLGVKCIGVLGSLAICPGHISRNREIGAFLLAVINNLPQTPPEDAIEALNQMFDVYADKEFDYDDAVFVKDRLLACLQAMQPMVQKMAKGIDKRKDPDLRGRADEAVVNLKRFVKYKTEESKVVSI